MIRLIIGVVLILIAVAAFFLATRLTEPEEKTGARGVGVVSLLIALLCILTASLTIVGTRNIGVVTTFGKPTGRTLENGLHFKAPWQSVTDIDGTISAQKFVGEDGCIGVRISDGSTGCISTVIRSRIVASEADSVFVDYRKSDTDIEDEVNDTLVRTQLTSALASSFEDYNPLLVPGSVEDSQTTANPDMQTYAKEVREKMENLLAEQSKTGKAQVEIVGITISYIRLSESTQDRLNQLQAEVANTRIAKQKEATASAQAAANKKLSDSISNDPNVLVSKCFDTLQERTEKGQNIPAGFSCWPGSSTGVVIPSGR